MVRGIERGLVFRSDKDRNAFVDRLGEILTDKVVRNQGPCIAARVGDLERVAARVSEVLNMKAEEVLAAGKYKRTVEARSLLCYWAVRACPEGCGFRFRLSVNPSPEDAGLLTKGSSSY